MEHPQFKINEDQNNSSDKRLIIFGGKGGVGKSSISSSTAVFLSHLLPKLNFLQYTPSSGSWQGFLTWFG